MQELCATRAVKDFAEQNHESPKHENTKQKSGDRWLYFVLSCFGLS